MIDFLKGNPSITVDDYLWKLSVPMIKIMAVDGTHTVYLSEKQAKKEKARRNSVRVDDPMQLLADTGAPVFNNKKDG